MKFIFVMMLASTVQLALAEAPPCDVRPGESLGIKVMEFASGHTVHSKMTFKELSPEALAEEMVSLQDMGVCEEKILAKKCVLKFEKQKKANAITLFRGADRWLTWGVSSKKNAQDFVKSLKRVGFCS